MACNGVQWRQEVTPGKLAYVMTGRSRPDVLDAGALHRGGAAADAGAGDSSGGSGGSGTGISGGGIRRVRYDLAERPFMVIWELTRACDLACRHCRAVSQREPDADDLTTAEGLELLEQVASLGHPRPLLILSGGDPFKRHDLQQLVTRASKLGLPVSVSPSVTPLATKAALAALRRAGAVAISLSIDGATAETHDGFRQVDGAFERTIEAARHCSEIGLRFQVNTTVTPHDIDELAEIALLVRGLGAMTWSVFFLVQTGRGRDLDLIPAQEADDLMGFLYETGKFMAVKTTEAPQYRRVVLHRRVLADLGIRTVPPPMSQGRSVELSKRFVAGVEAAGARATSSAAERARSLPRRPPMNINAGKGFVFVSHRGDVYPSGFLPLAAGNVRNAGIASIYRSSELLQGLRDHRRLQGRCGQCELASVCGGSRSRAFASTGNPWGEDPLCPYVPRSFPHQEELSAYLA